ncbi:hypothetical protein [Labrys neptuniae]|uniref:Uncharacterized protein n=1 Tax=Labrys neptuniae TaxID=376174 RepID=A0ABV3PHM5_9HYPH
MIEQPGPGPAAMAAHSSPALEKEGCPHIEEGRSYKKTIIIYFRNDKMVLMR